MVSSMGLRLRFGPEDSAAGDAIMSQQARDNRNSNSFDQNALLGEVGDGSKSGGSGGAGFPKRDGLFDTDQ
jgi:hypothetical protein